MSVWEILAFPAAVVAMMALFGVVGFGMWLMVLRPMRRQSRVRRRIRTPIVGTIQVTALPECDEEVYEQIAMLSGIVSAPGVVQRKVLLRTADWPRIGQAFPVTFDRDDPGLFAIEWEQVESGSE